MLSPHYAVIWGWCMQYPLKPVVHVMVVLNLFNIEPWDNIMPTGVFYRRNVLISSIDWAQTSLANDTSCESNVTTPPNPIRDASNPSG